MASTSKFISDPFWDILWLRARAHFGPVLQLGGIYADKVGYHNTVVNNQNKWPNNYSVRRTVDREPPRDKSRAIDWTFRNPEVMKTVTRRFLKAYDDPEDPRIGPHNVAEIYGTTNGTTVVGRLHGRHATSDDSHLWHIHFAVATRFANSKPIAEAILSVMTGESKQNFLERTQVNPTEEDVEKVAVVSDASAIKIAQAVHNQKIGGSSITIGTALERAYVAARDQESLKTLLTSILQEVLKDQGDGTTVVLTEDNLKALAELITRTIELQGQFKIMRVTE